MPFKKLKTPTKIKKLNREWFACSESKLQEIAFSFVKQLKRGDRILLEGEMGAGKSTFVRFCLDALGVDRPSEGSPTFALVHEYGSTDFQRIVHTDFYRLKKEQEIEEAGIEEIFWNPSTLIFGEWVSLFPRFESDVVTRSPSGTRVWRVNLSIHLNDKMTRDLKIDQLPE